ncbi:hypothetical protein BUALT_Bualt12G0084500 [Buddleja alternifolia]|uniref:Uncharacterized protein n=1 Tax=Buddleja alternifolia TaxID=168488 RepID=A0AAV6WR97_9LAMI|nr:hypothetical protein BUALT_Bualt12G0084500 [Buddleja alternifolia]
MLTMHAPPIIGLKTFSLVPPLDIEIPRNALFFNIFRIRRPNHNPLEPNRSSRPPHQHTRLSAPTDIASLRYCPCNPLKSQQCHCTATPQTSGSLPIETEPSSNETWWRHSQHIWEHPIITVFTISNFSALCSPPDSLPGARMTAHCPSLISIPKRTPNILKLGGKHLYIMGNIPYEQFCNQT